MSSVNWGLKKPVEAIAKEIAREMAYDLKHIMQSHAVSDHKNPTGALASSISLRKQSDLVYWVGVNGGTLRSKDRAKKASQWYKPSNGSMVTFTQFNTGVDYGAMVNDGHAGARYSRTTGTVKGKKAYLINGRFIRTSIDGYGGSHWFDNAFDEFMAKEY